MLDSSARLSERLAAGLREVIVGHDEVIRALLVGLFASGHVLVEGVPGTAKTLIVRALAALLGLQFKRIQFTPDLMPSDVIGTTVFNQSTAQFTPRFGPIFANVVLADEINRTPPKTQSALLEAMEEGQVTIDGTSHPLPDPFMVAATQNSIEYEGTYPLPEAQLDRFMLKVVAGYPSPDEEQALLARVAAGFDARDLRAAGLNPFAQAADVARVRRQARTVHVSPALQAYIASVVLATREDADVLVGASPRAGIALLVAAQANAAIEERDFATPDDVKMLAPLVLPHRLVLRPEAEIEGTAPRQVVGAILERIAVPKT